MSSSYGKFDIHETFLCSEMNFIPIRKERDDKKTPRLKSSPREPRKQLSPEYYREYYKTKKKEYMKLYHIKQKEKATNTNYNFYKVCCIKCGKQIQVRSLYRHHKSDFCKGVREPKKNQTAEYYRQYCENNKQKKKEYYQQYHLKQKQLANKKNYSYHKACCLRCHKEIQVRSLNLHKKSKCCAKI